ncbi:MAG TPA: hypothetical protein VET85_04030, partial [Stellaceae bacterium]|nr:hypothetical protein [Stellaceae bacterium]
LMGERQVNFHPLINTQSTGIDPRDLVRFIESTGHRPLTISFADGEAVTTPNQQSSLYEEAGQ